ncbi:UNVERIFIED_ORG: 3-oxoacyl-[acyl-carrier protein] reductase [Methylorubrum zatmanii]|nr:3-oxoacyl-[acyl-carrier protein] reductase [Methylorubrum extorquens]
MKQGPHDLSIWGLEPRFVSSEIPNYGTEVTVPAPAHVEGLAQMSKLEGKVAVVTGASKGIGAAIAKALAKDGATVVVNYASSKAGADAVVDAITAAGGKAVAVQADVSQAAQARGLVEAAVQQFGRLDVLVNNSGVYEFAAIEEVTEEHYRRIFDVNVLGVLLATQAASKHLGEGGSIINISSVVTDVLMPTSAVYSGTKGALNAISGVLANELAPRKIRVNVVSPGYVVTEGTHTAGIAGSEMEAGLVAQTPLGRSGQPDDIAGVVAFLASDDARWVTGEVINASGGVR